MICGLIGSSVEQRTTNLLVLVSTGDIIAHKENTSEVINFLMSNNKFTVMNFIELKRIISTNKSSI